jgi:hypothetical protein
MEILDHLSDCKVVNGSVSWSVCGFVCFVFAESLSNTVNSYWPGLAREAMLFVPELHSHPSSGWLAHGMFV